MNRENKGTLAMKNMKLSLIANWNKNPKLCKECKNAISYKNRRNVFCCRNCSAIFTNKVRCANGWTHSKKTIDILRESGKKYGKLSYNTQKKKKLSVVCKSCKSIFNVHQSASNRKYCSRICASSDSTKYKNCGGYRPGSGKSKSGYYKGIYCGSTYELCWVIYALDTGIKFSRFPHMLVGDEIKYLPDFLLEDGKTIIELKGYESSDSVDRKTKLAESFGYVVNVLRKENLIDIFSYVEKTYGTKKFYTLYDK